MSKDSPAPPDYRGAAEATAASNIAQTAYQTNANRPNVYTPWGSQTWENNKQFDQSGYDAALGKYQAANPTGKWVEGTDATPGTYDSGMQSMVGGSPATAGHFEGTTGAPIGKAPNKDDFYTDKWTSNINLDPAEQKALDDQQEIQAGRSSAAKGLLHQATDAFNTPFDWGSLTARQNTLPGGSSAYRQKAQDAIEQLQQPALDRRRASEETRLANQGITRGSEAYQSDMRDVSDNENRAHLAAIDSARQEDSMKFGQDLTSANFQNNSRQSQIAEMMQRRGMSLNELNALLTGQQVQNPNMPNVQQAGKSAGVDYAGAQDSQYNAALGQANASNASSGQTMSALASAAGMAAMFAFSDVRLKEDISEVGLLPSGVRVVYYRYRGRPRRYLGVIAQEVAQVLPEAVSLHPSGFLQVDYSKVH